MRYLVTQYPGSNPISGIEPSTRDRTQYPGSNHPPEHGSVRPQESRRFPRNQGDPHAQSVPPHRFAGCPAFHRHDPWRSGRSTRCQPRPGQDQARRSAQGPAFPSLGRGVICGGPSFACILPTESGTGHGATSLGRSRPRRKLRTAALSASGFFPTSGPIQQRT